MTTSPNTQKAVLTLHDVNLANKKQKPIKLTQKHIASQLDIPRRTVANIIKRGKISTVKKKRGPKPKIDKEAIVAEVHASKELREMTNAELAEHYGICTRYLRQTLNNAGLCSRRRRTKPFINETNRIKRLHFAMEHAEWTVEDWKRVIWTDETYIYYKMKKQDARVRRMDGEAWEIDNISPTFQSGRKGVMIWGAFGGGKAGPMKILKTLDEDTMEYNGKNPKVNAAYYTEEILQKELLPYYLDSLDDIGYTEVCQDNAPSHKSKVTKEWCNINAVVCMAWPATSPDLNAIENIWDILKRAVNARKPTSYQEMMRFCREEWAKIPEKYFLAMVESLPNRINEILRSLGHPIRY